MPLESQLGIAAGFKEVMQLGSKEDVSLGFKLSIAKGGQKHTMDACYKAKIKGCAMLVEIKSIECNICSNT
jgi:hypothetical protein